MFSVLCFPAETADVLAIARHHGIGSHSYTDDRQLYHHAPADLCIASAPAVVSCFGELDKWMCNNCLKLNTDKTDFILLGKSQQIGKANLHSVQLGGINVHLSTVTCHQQWADVLSPHQALHQTVLLSASSAMHCPSCPISWGCTDTCPCFYHQPRGLLLQHPWSTSAVHLRLLQCVLNEAERLIVKTQKFDRITDCLPVQYRHTYKICLLIYKCLHGTAPSYLIEQYILVAVNPVGSSSQSASNLNLIYYITDPSLSFDNFCRKLKLLFNRAYYVS